jgi:DNA-binding response OmpR family regulator
MDVHIAGDDTFDLLREIKADETWRSVPVIMTSGIDYSEKCAVYGADVFLVKPFRPKELLHIVKEIFGDQDTSHGKKKEQ